MEPVTRPCDVCGETHVQGTLSGGALAMAAHDACEGRRAALVEGRVGYVSGLGLGADGYRALGFAVPPEAPRGEVVVAVEELEDFITGDRDEIVFGIALRLNTRIERLGLDALGDQTKQELVKLFRRATEIYHVAHALVRLVRELRNGIGFYAGRKRAEAEVRRSLVVDLTRQFGPWFPVLMRSTIGIPVAVGEARIHYGAGTWNYPEGDWLELSEPLHAALSEAVGPACGPHPLLARLDRERGCYRAEGCATVEIG